MTTAETIRSQLHLDRIVIQHHGGTVTLTPEQGRKVLAGGELVADALGVSKVTEKISATIYTYSDEALNTICLAKIISRADCYKIYRWASAELCRLQDQAVAAGRPMADAEVMFPDAWRNNKRIFETFLAAFKEHLRIDDIPDE